MPEEAFEDSIGPAWHGPDQNPGQLMMPELLDSTAGTATTEAPQGAGPLIPSHQLRKFIMETLISFRSKTFRHRATTNRKTGPFECTSKCGESFAKASEWKRHEELHQPQEIYICTICCNLENPSLKAFRFRKDKMIEHLSKSHSDSMSEEGMLERSIRAMKVDYPTPFTTRCGFCNRGDWLAPSWQARIEHIRRHFRNNLTMQHWRVWPEDEEIIEDDDNVAVEASGDTDDSNDNHQDPVAITTMVQMTTTKATNQILRSKVQTQDFHRVTLRTSQTFLKPFQTWMRLQDGSGQV